MKWTFMPLGAVLLLALCCVSPVRAATAVDTVHVDLDPLIDAAVNFRNRFAVDVHHSISSASNGKWTSSGSTSTWVYSARIPTAVSMSFHASDLQLPPSAVLKVSSSRNSANYVAHDVSRGGLWGRPLAGDTLDFALTVNTAEASQVRLQIDSLQAGAMSARAPPVAPCLIQTITSWVVPVWRSCPTARIQQACVRPPRRQFRHRPQSPPGSPAALAAV